MHFERQLNWNKAHENLLRAKYCSWCASDYSRIGSSLLKWHRNAHSAPSYCVDNFPMKLIPHYVFAHISLKLPDCRFQQPTPRQPMYVVSSIWGSINNFQKSAFGAENVETMFPTLEWHTQSILVRDSAIAHRLNKIKQKQSALSQCTDNANKRFWIRRHLKSTYADAANLASRLCASYQVSLKACLDLTRCRDPLTLTTQIQTRHSRLRHWLNTLSTTIVF